MKNRKTQFTGLMVLIMLLAPLLSFTSKVGGEGYFISVNGKRVIEDFSNGKKKDLPVLTLQSDEGQVSIFYSHCGEIGTNRVVTINDENEVLRKWDFSEVSADKMVMHAKDFKVKSNSKSLQLIYTCDQIPKGRVLAAIQYAPVLSGKK